MDTENSVSTFSNSTTPTELGPQRSGVHPQSSQPHPTHLEQWWRVVVLAGRLSCTRQSVYKLIKRGELDAVRLVGGLRVPESSVLAYISRCRGK